MKKCTRLFNGNRYEKALPVQTNPLPSLDPPDRSEHVTSPCFILREKMYPRLTENIESTDVELWRTHGDIETVLRLLAPVPLPSAS